MTRDDDLRVMLDRQHIYDVIVRYCRGVDRGDRELLRSVYHEDAIDDHGMFKGKGSDFADWIVDLLGETRCQHFIGNFACELHGDVAYTETYCISCSEAGTTTATVYNRYIDRFEKRNEGPERSVVPHVSPPAGAMRFSGEKMQEHATWTCSRSGCRASAPLQAGA